MTICRTDTNIQYSKALSGDRDHRMISHIKFTLMVSCEITVLMRFCPWHSKNVFVLVLAHLEPEPELFEVDDFGDDGDDDLSYNYLQNFKQL